MPEISFTGLFVVVAIATTAPLLLGLAPAVRIPAVVLEITLGVMVGPSVLGWVEVDLPIHILSLLGLAFLLFLAGLEIDLRGLRGTPARLAGAGYAVSVGLGVVIGFTFADLDWVSSPLLLGIAMSATALGLVLPVLKDAGCLQNPAGQLTIAGSSVADFGSVILLTLFFSQGGTLGSKLVLLGCFVLLAAVATVVLTKVQAFDRLTDVVRRQQDTTAQLRIRTAVLLLVAFVALAEKFGLETLLGAFIAGAILNLVDHDAMAHPNFRPKLEAIGYGFVIPVFFVTAGLSLDLRALFASPEALLRVPVFLLALLAIRGIPALLYRRLLKSRETIGAGLLQAVSLPFLVAATDIGVALGKVQPVNAAALICGGLLSVLVFPPAALSLLRKSPPSKPA